MAFMSTGLASLHKILKDETRRKTILLLDERGALSYTDLMDELGIVSTGMLNYHLKVLGDLIFKNDNGQYALTEKGKLASRLLTEFPEDYQQQRRIWQRRFFTALVI
jgi:predicted transcriptional regulator